MRYRQLGKTGAYISEIALGVGSFGRTPGTGGYGQAEADALVGCAVEMGVNLFDTADVYGNGISETMLGHAIRNLGLDRSSLMIASKAYGPIGPAPNDRGASRVHLLDAVKKSLGRLRTDHIDLYQIHSQDMITPLDETLRALDDLISQGLVRYIGCSNWHAYRMTKALGIAERHGWSPIVTNQIHYSLPVRDAEREIVPCAIEEGIGLLIWSPVGAGAITDARKPVPGHMQIDQDRLARCLSVMEIVGREAGLNIAQVGVAWLLGRPAVNSVLIGAGDVEELRANLRAGEAALTVEQMAMLDEASALTPEFPEWVLKQNAPYRIPLPFEPHR